MDSPTIKSIKFQKLLKREFSCIKRPYAIILSEISMTKKISVAFNICSLKF